jgi:flagellar biosynthesis protein FlhA
VIVALNLAGGLVVGVFYHDMGPLDALQTFAILSIGNALVTTLPAFLISTSMGLMVTRVAGEGALAVDLAAQLIARPDALRTAGVLMAVLAFVPALPAPVFGALALAAFGGASASGARRKRADDALRAAAERRRKDAVRRPESAFALVGVDALSIDVGTDLYALLAPPNADALLDRIGDVRRALAAETGIVIPGVRLRDDGLRAPDTYAIRVRDRIAGEGRLLLDRLLAVAPEPVLAQIEGEPCLEPVYGLTAKSILPEARELAQAAGALAFDAISIIGSHLSEIVRANAAELFGRQEFQTLLEHLRAQVPSIVKDVGSDALPVVTAHRAVGLLLRERAWPRDPITVFEAMLDAAPHAREPRELAEAVRRIIVPQQFRRDGITRIRPLILAPEFDAELARMWSADTGLAPDPQTARHVRERAAQFLADTAFAPHAVVVSAALRPLIAEFFERVGPRIEVYAFGEIPPGVDLEPAGVLDTCSL